MLELSYFRLTVTANMDVNYGHYDNSIDEFDVARRKAVRRVLNIPYDTHSNLMPLLMSDTLALPFFDEICKRSARFILSCIQSESFLFVLLSV